MIKNLKIDENFYLIENTINNTNENDIKPTPKLIPVNFIVNIDVSGSMSWDLSKIRLQLKNKLPNLVKEGDTITLIWFSGNNQAGILKEEVEIKSVTNLQDLNNAIDRFLQPVGLTAFAKPLQLTKEAIERIRKNRPTSIFSLLFLTDGGNNDCSWSEVVKSLKSLESDLASSTFIEYGLYADSKRLTEMAEAIGGEKLLANGFDEYEPIFESKITKTLSASKKVTVDVDSSKYEFAFTINDLNEILVFGINNNQILINDNIDKIYYFSTKKLSNDELVFNDVNNKSLAKIIYTSIYVLSDRTLNTDVEVMFNVLGDVYAFNMFNNSFGKQKLNAFKSFIKECTTDEDKRFIEGKKDKLVLDENTYCFLNLIDDLSKGENNLFYPDHDDFNYKRIGTKKVQSSTKLNEELKNKIADIDNINELVELVDSIKENSVGELKFEYSEPGKGYPLSDLVWNESRANLSVRVRYNGYVNLPANQFNIDKIDTFIYRTYTIVKDGILNVSKLPVSIDEETYNKLSVNNLIPEKAQLNKETTIYTIDFSSLPIINRSMVKNISAKALAESEWELLKLQASKKVYDSYEKTLYPKTSDGFVDKYGVEAEAWLKAIGITEGSGFAPKLTSAESTDFYMAVLLDTKIAGYSTLPKVSDVESKLNQDKDLKPAELLMSYAVIDYNTQIRSDLYTSQSEEVQKTILKSWLSKCKKQFVDQKRQAMINIAKIKFSLILSKGWFTEFKSFEENTLDVEVDGKTVKFQFDLKEKEEKI